MCGVVQSAVARAGAGEGAGVASAVVAGACVDAVAGVAGAAAVAWESNSGKCYTS